MSTKMVVIDFETFYGTKYSLTSMSYEEYIFDERFRIHCCGFKVNDEKPYVVFKHEAVCKELQRLFPPGNGNILICHNALFDAAIACWVAGVKASLYVDTMCMSKLIFPSDSASLESVAKRVLNKEKGKDLVQFKNVEVLEESQQFIMKRYCLRDVELCAELALYFDGVVPHQSLLMVDMTVRMYIDRPLEVNKELLEEFLDEEQRHRDELVKKSGLPCSLLASTKQFGDWIVSQGMDFPKIHSPTAKDPENTKYPLEQDSEQFANLRLEHPEYNHIWEARLCVASTIHITRAKRILSHSRYHPQYNPQQRLGAPLICFGAHTHRWTGTNRINLQNLPRGSALRRALRAPEGRVLVVFDQKQIEARVLAWMAQERSLLRAYKNKEDVYCSFASIAFDRQITEEQVTERFIGKVCCLGLGYGMGAQRLHRTLKLGSMGAPIHVPIPECQQLVHMFRGTYNRIPLLWQEADNVIRHMATASNSSPPLPWRCLKVHAYCIQLPDQTLLQYPGLRYNIGDEEDRDPRYEYWNGKYWTKLYGGKLVENVVQALARIIIADNALQASLVKDAQLALFVHDEIVVSVLEDKADEFFQFIGNHMRTNPSWADDTLVLDVSGGYAKEYTK